MYFSTHNALRNASDGDDQVWIIMTEIDGGPRKTSFLVYPFYDIEMVKRLIIKRLNLPKSTNVSELRIFYRGSELPNHRSLTPFVTESERTKIRLQWSFKDVDESVGLRETGLRPPPILHSLISEINLGLQRGMNPKLTMDGTGGTYILSNAQRQHIAMFKPEDEEAFAPNNPRGYEGHLGQKGFRPGVVSGEGSCREVAAFLLDAQYGGLAGVPQTTKVEACHPSFCYKTTRQETISWKNGSLQEFVDAKDTCGDFDPKVFSIGDAHKIGILDLRVLNIDRNDGNILVAPANRTITSCIPSEDILTPEGKISKFRLIPIDHGLILPDTMDLGDIDLVWFYWPQSKIPFSESELRYIFSLDPDKDAWRLSRKLEIRDECLRTMRVSTRVLQIGATMHLTLHQIASLVVRMDDFELPSIMERAVKTALMQACTAVNASSYIQQNRLPGSVLLDLHIPERIVTDQRSIASSLSTEIHPNYHSLSTNDSLNRQYQQNHPFKNQKNARQHSCSNQSLLYTDSSMMTQQCLSSSLEEDHFTPITTMHTRLHTTDSTKLNPIISHEISFPMMNNQHHFNHTCSPTITELTSCTTTTTLGKEMIRSNTFFSLSPFDGIHFKDPSNDSSWDSMSNETSSADIDITDCCTHKDPNIVDSAIITKHHVPQPKDNSLQSANHLSTIPLIDSTHPSSYYDDHPPLDYQITSSSRIPQGSLKTDQAKKNFFCSTDENKIQLPLSNEEISGQMSCPSPRSISQNRIDIMKETSSHITTGVGVGGLNNLVQSRPLCNTTRLLKKKTTFNEFDGIGTRTGTGRRRPTALQRRGTTSHMRPKNVNCTWTLIDNNRKPIPLEWDNPLLEKMFFECFEIIIKHHIVEAHPDWHTYPFNGHTVLKEFECAAAAAAHHRRHKRRSSHSQRIMKLNGPGGGSSPCSSATASASSCNNYIHSNQFVSIDNGLHTRHNQERSI